MLQLRDIMTPDVLALSPELAVRDAMELLSSRHLSGAPVVAGRKVVGVVSATDLLTLAASVPRAPTAEAEADYWNEGDELPVWEDGDEPPSRYFTEHSSDAGSGAADRVDGAASGLEEYTVSELMTRKVCSLPPTASVTAAADLMRTAHVHRVLVMDGAHLAGIVSTSDIARAVADHRLVQRTYVFDKSAPERDRDAGSW